MESIPTAAIPIPYNPSIEFSKPPAKAKAPRIPIAIVRTGIAVEIIPVARPPMISVASPVLAFSAICIVGLYPSEV